MKKLWQKSVLLNKLVEEYCSKDNVVLDNNLIFEDLFGSWAHLVMLKKIKIVREEEKDKIHQYLLEIFELTKKRKFKVTFGDEDVHTKVESYLTNKLGVIGKKIHTGRSRNDQVLTDLKLYSKKQMIETACLTIVLVKQFIGLAKKHDMVVMPGYTHMQKAMPSTVGLWLGSFTESLIDDLKVLKTAYDINNQSPLGSGAAYGVSLPIDRQLVADLLGFEKVQNNSLYCQSSRPKNHLLIIQALVHIMLTLSRFAEDVLLFTTAEFNFLKVNESLCIGSSIMPQKKNVDIMEFVRARVYKVIANTGVVANISAGLPSGYHSDFAETKGPLMETFATVIDSLKIIGLLLSGLTINKKVIEKANTKELYATYAAYELVKKGVPFREAYLEVGQNLNKLSIIKDKLVLKQSNHLGGIGNLNLNQAINDLIKTKKFWQREENLWQKNINNFIKKYENKK